MKRLLVSILFLVFSVKPAFAQVAGHLPGGDFATLDQLGIVFANLVGAVTTLVGFAALGMLLVGGFRYMVANGDPKAIAQARGTITWAVGGLVFVIAAFIIMQILIGFVSLPVLGKFCIPAPGVHCSSESL